MLQRALSPPPPFSPFLFSLSFFPPLPPFFFSCIFYPFLHRLQAGSLIFPPQFPPFFSPSFPPPLLAETRAGSLTAGQVRPLVFCTPRGAPWFSVVTKIRWDGSPAASSSVRCGAFQIGRQRGGGLNRTHQRQNTCHCLTPPPTPPGVSRADIHIHVSNGQDRQ
jgi:hypothetical protein